MVNTVGHPLKFETPEIMQEKIDAYFSSLKEDEPVTVTGLALALDTTRETLMDYQNKDEYSDTVKRAKLRVEHYAEKRLYNGPATGPIFALKNFGWKDSQDMNLGGQPGNPLVAKIEREIIDPKDSNA